MAVSLALQRRYATTPRSHAPDEALYMSANVHNHGMRGRGYDTTGRKLIEMQCVGGTTHFAWKSICNPIGKMCRDG